MVAEPELGRFLAELNTRRRLLSAAGAQSSFDAEVLAELTELGEQLVVADAELRAQHEELEAAREALLRAQVSYEQLLAETPTAYLLTDQNGIVRQLNAAAQALLGHSMAGQRIGRPLATKFQISDRSRVRSLLSQLKRSSGDPATCRASVQRPDGSLVEVEVTGRLVTDLHAEGATLSWQLRPVRGAPSRLHSVPTLAESSADEPAAGELLPGAPAAEKPQPPAGLLAEIAGLAATLAGQHSTQDVLDQAVQAARHAVTGAEQASISLVDKAGNLSTPSSTGELATAGDKAQYELGEGPCLQALWDGQVLQIDDLSVETRWPAWTARAQALGAGSMLACQLATPRGMLGALNLYSTRPHAFDPTAAALIPVLATQVGIALARVQNEANLRAAIESRQLIGQAVGILMERHRLGATAAFDLLVRASQASQLKLREVAIRVNETGQDPAEAVLPW
jgi:PAS domain S-box-containing protein